MLEEGEIPKGSMANLDSSNVEQKALLSVHTCLVILISLEDPSLIASRWYSPMPQQLHEDANVSAHFR
jgi:hypothetical protein